MDDYACMFCDGHHGPERGLVNCVRILADRVKELESKLGAVSDGNASEAAERQNLAHAAEQQSKLLADSDDRRRVAHSTAPSVSVQRWFAKGLLFSGLGDRDTARACDLAAAVTEWWQRHELDDSRDETSEAFLFSVVIAFVRGEPLPEKRP